MATLTIEVGMGCAKKSGNETHQMIKMPPWFRICIEFSAVKNTSIHRYTMLIAFLVYSCINNLSKESQCIFNGIGIMGNVLYIWWTRIIV